MALSQKSVPDTILLKGFDNAIFHEANAAVGTILPGHIVELDSSGNLILGATTNTLLMIAREDDLQGNGITDLYPILNRVLLFCPARGSEVYLILTDGQNISIGEDVEFGVAGEVKTADGTQAVVGTCVEAVDASDSAVTPLASRRIKIRVA